MGGGTTSSGPGCEPTVTYALNLYPDKLALNFSDGWRVFPTDSSGHFSSEVVNHASNLRFTVSGNLNDRTVSVRGHRSNCTWVGNF